jgi:hypothetical protein
MKACDEVVVFCVVDSGAFVVDGGAFVVDGSVFIVVVATVGVDVVVKDV